MRKNSFESMEWSRYVNNSRIRKAIFSVRLQRIWRCLMCRYVLRVMFPILLTMIYFTPLHAQFRHLEPIPAGNPELKNIALGFTIRKLEDDDYKSNWASSYLPAEGKAPQVPDYDKYNNALDSDDESIFENELNIIDAYNAWQTMYSAYRASDGDNTTCWAVSGKGIGEVLIVKLDSRKPVSISSGFQKSPDLFKKNSRPHMVRVWVLEPAHHEVTESSVVDSDIKAIAYLDVELKDIFGKQPLPIPSYKPTLIKTHPDGSSIDEPF
jgi:hypothetical protein